MIPFELHEEPCIRNKDGYIVAWCAGMSDEDIEAWLKKYPDNYLSTEY